MTIYQSIGLSRTINASGRVTILGVSTISDMVAEAAVKGAKSYVVIEDLIKKAGKIIASYTGAEDACVTSCASAAIAMTTAALIAGDKKSLIQRMPDSSGLANEIVIQKGHNIDFGVPISTMVRLGGGILAEAGCVNEVYPEDIEEAITDKTVALLYVKSHHSVQKGMVPLETMISIAHRNNLPIIIDAAAEEDLKKYIGLGADLVCYSGAKALEATTSGFVTGKERYISLVQKQYQGVGRAMKIGKEGIMGLLAALEQYDKKDREAEVEKNIAIVDYLCEELSKIPGLKAVKIQDEAGRAIYRARITLTDKERDMSEINRSLREGDPCIYCRTEFLNLGMIDLDPRPLVAGDKEEIVKKFRILLGK